MNDLMREAALDDLMELPKAELLALAGDRGVALPRKPTKMQIAEALIASEPGEEPTEGEATWIEQMGGPVGALRNLYAVMRGATRKEFLEAAARVGLNPKTAATYRQKWRHAASTVALEVPASQGRVGNTE